MTLMPLESYLRTVVTTFRDLYEDLSDEERSEAQLNTTLDKPCQIEFFSFDDNGQIMIVANRTDSPDDLKVYEHIIESPIQIIREKLDKSWESNLSLQINDNGRVKTGVWVSLGDYASAYFFNNLQAEYPSPVEYGKQLFENAKTHIRIRLELKRQRNAKHGSIEKEIGSVRQNVPLAKLGWLLGDSSERHALYYEYYLTLGPNKKYYGNIDIPSKYEQLLQYFFQWVLENSGKPKSYKILGTIITPYYEISEIRHAIISNTFDTPENEYRFTLEIVHPVGKEVGPNKSFSKTIFPAEVQDFLTSLDELLWDKIRNELIEKFQLSKTSIPSHLEKHVFIAYRATNEKSVQVAEKIGKFLEDRNIRVWYFPRRVGWSDSLIEKEEEAIANSFGAVLCVTPDFLEGQIAKEEYRALLAMRRKNSNFKLGYLLVGCDYGNVPPFMSDCFGARVERAEDENFPKEASKIFRGLLGLPQNAP